MITPPYLYANTEYGVDDSAIDNTQRIYNALLLSYRSGSGFFSQVENTVNKWQSITTLVHYTRSRHSLTSRCSPWHGWDQELNGFT